MVEAVPNRCTTMRDRVMFARGVLLGFAVAAMPLAVWRQFF